MTGLDTLAHLALVPGEWVTARELAAGLEVPERQLVDALVLLEARGIVESVWGSGRRWFRRVVIPGPVGGGEGATQLAEPLFAGCLAWHVAIQALCLAGMPVARALAEMATGAGEATRWG